VDLSCVLLLSFNYYHLIYFKFAWSRKGFIGTRWKINEKEFCLINVHLFHDPSNIEALDKV
jgi:hypothetical protein